MDDENVTVTCSPSTESQRLSEYTAPHDAILQVVDWTAIITVSGHDSEVDAGEAVVLPADEPHAVEAVSPFKMVLTMIW